uniref:Pecanex-like protein n=1 Tax=Haemonchus placei TaxID=6290 RepID=A0A0N4WXG4_HAEPC
LMGRRGALDATSSFNAFICCSSFVSSRFSHESPSSSPTTVGSSGMEELTSTDFTCELDCPDASDKPAIGSNLVAAVSVDDLFKSMTGSKSFGSFSGEPDTVKLSMYNLRTALF